MIRHIYENPRKWKIPRRQNQLLRPVSSYQKLKTSPNTGTYKKKKKKIKKKKNKKMKKKKKKNIGIEVETKLKPQGWVSYI